MNSNDTQKVLARAAKSALAEWHSGQWDLQDQELDNLTNDLWVWYLERPSVQTMLETSDGALAHKLIKKAALQTLSGHQLEANTFQNKNLFSSDAVKDALKGRSTNKYLKAILPIALAAVQHKDDSTPGREYAEALRKRYVDGLIPKTKHEDNQLYAAHKSITDEVNVSYITNDVEAIGSDKVVFPGLRRAKGEHGDPTGNMALLLMENPELKDEYLRPTPWQQVTQGQAAEPAYAICQTRIRPEAGSYPAWMLLAHPELLDVFVEAKKQELGW